RRKSAILADQRLREPILMVRKIEGISSLDAQKIAIDSAFVAIVATHNLHAGICSAHAQSSFAAVSTMGTGRANVFHFPRTSLIPISAGGQRRHRTNVNAHAAFFAFEV